jgi:dihydrodipicolinate synthase/N-acetylneuraminate lyase
VGDLRGTFAAALTPLRAGGDAVDPAAVEPYVDFRAAGGVDGLLVLGTTGEGILLSPSERTAVAEAFLAAASRRVSIIVHCGAQTTADTVALARHAAEHGADGVAVIGPPYFALDEREQLDHFAAAAAACAPVPFFIYEFAARTGYSVAPAVIAALRERAPSFTGLKVSNAAWESFRPYLVEGLDVFVGPEALIHRGLGLGAVGAVSGLAASFPEAVARVVAEPSADAAAHLGALRQAIQSFPFHAAQKLVVARRGVPLGADVRRPLRTLTDDEQAALFARVDELAAAPPWAPATIDARPDRSFQTRPQAEPAAADGRHRKRRRR